MKKALVMTFVLVLGLGFAASAVSLAGEWSGTVEFDPGAVAFADFLTDFSSDLSVTYSIGSFSVTSETGFDSLGYASQAFSAEVILGALIFSSEMSFLPRGLQQTLDTYSYGGNLYEDINFVGPPILWFPYTLVPPVVETVVTVDTFVVAMDDWLAEASISLAGVNLGSLFFFEFWPGTLELETYPIYEYEWITLLGAAPPALAIVDITNEVAVLPDVDFMPQTGTYTVDNQPLTPVGAGWRFMISGTLSPVTITSYTYFNLFEGFAMDDDPDTKSFARNGDFTTGPDQVVRFTEEYIVIEGLSLGCIVWDAALRITCLNGFEYLSLWFKDIYLLCCGISTDFEIDFLLAEKRVELFPEITIDWVCWEPTLTLNWADNGITGITLDALSVSVALNGLTFSATTTWDGSMGTLDGGTTEDWYFLVPAVLPAGAVSTVVPYPLPVIDTLGFGLYIVDHVSFSDDYYELFESFTITYESDSCCGGLFEITVETLFGNRFTETLAEWGYWYETNGALVNIAMLYGQGAYFDVADTLNPAASINNGWFFYDENYTSPPAWWYPGDGWAPVRVEEIAYSALIGLDGTPTVYAGTAIVESLTPSAFGTTKTAAGGQLFGWAQTSIDVTLGIGSNFSLIFGLDVGAYGWTRASGGFSFTF